MIATQPMNETSRRTAIRVPIAQPDDLYARALAKYARRTYGDVPDNVLVLLKHRPALKAMIGFERRVAKFDRLDADLKALALTASAAMIGCSWCLDFGYYMAYTQGNDLGKLREVPRWRGVRHLYGARAPRARVFRCDDRYAADSHRRNGSEAD